MNTIGILAALIVSIILHEACHALALRTIGAPIHRFQIGTPVIYRRSSFSLGLIPLFGAVEADLSAISLPKQAFYYTAGPVGSLLLGIAVIAPGVWLNIYFIKLLGIVSLVIGIFNLIPVPPLDGYRLVTLGRQVSYRVQIAWTVVGWGLIAMGTFLRVR
jgi:membrane-associated protease RseP (regulator of RpoE activity)